MSKDKIYTAIGVVFAMGGWMLFPLAYEYIKPYTMTTQEKKEIEQNKIIAKENIRIYKENIGKVENICGPVPEVFEIKGSSGDRFTEAEEWKEYHKYTEETESWWMDCIYQITVQLNQKCEDKKVDISPDLVDEVDIAPKF